jgi:hypothetical protein
VKSLMMSAVKALNALYFITTQGLETTQKKKGQQFSFSVLFMKMLQLFG